jgi:hypothetical protein
VGIQIREVWTDPAVERLGAGATRDRRFARGARGERDEDKRGEQGGDGREKTKRARKGRHDGGEVGRWRASVARKSGKCGSADVLVGF